MKTLLALMMTHVLLIGFSACGKETVEHANNQEEWTESTIVVGVLLALSRKVCKFFKRLDN